MGRGQLNNEKRGANNNQIDEINYRSLSKGDIPNPNSCSHCSYGLIDGRKYCACSAGRDRMRREREGRKAIRVKVSQYSY